MQTTSSLTPEQKREILSHSIEHPEWYIEHVLGSNLWSKQFEIVQDIFKYSNVAVKTCNSVGKSYVAARIAVAYLNLYPDSIVVTTAPTWYQVVNVLWREIKTTVNRAKYKSLLLGGEPTQSGLNISDKWYAIGRSTSTPDNFMGIHADNLLVIVDEAGGVDDAIYKGVRAITTNVNNKTLLIGNPTNPGGVFWNAFEPGSKYIQHSISAFDTPNFTSLGIKSIDDLRAIFDPPPGLSQREQVEHFEVKKRSLQLPYPELTEPSDVYEKYLDWGIDSSAWQALVMGEFPNQSENSLFPVDLVQQAMNNYGVDEETGKTFAELSGWKIPSGMQEYGLDVARFGSDKTVLTSRRGGFVDPYTVGAGGNIWQNTDLITSADKVLALVDDYKYQNINIKIDDTGVGGGVSDALDRYAKQRTMVGQAPYLYRLSRYNMAMRPHNADKFHDITSEVYWNLATWFKNKAIALPYDKELFDELVGRRWKITDTGKIKVESKEDYRERTKSRSPDKSDSLALAFADDINLNPVQQTDYNELNKQRKIIDREAEELLQEDLRPVTGGLLDRY